MWQVQDLGQASRARPRAGDYRLHWRHVPPQPPVRRAVRRRLDHDQPEVWIHPPGLRTYGTYDVNFRLPATHPIAVEELQRQVRELGLDAYSDVTALGGSGYRGAITAAFAGTGATLHTPFAGLPIGKMMQATKAAVEAEHGSEVTGSQ